MCMDPQSSADLSQFPGVEPGSLRVWKSNVACVERVVHPELVAAALPPPRAVFLFSLLETESVQSARWRARFLP